jgi:hypothetical protein
MINITGEKTMNRTVKFYGLGYGPIPAEIKVMKDAELVYEGVVPTVDQKDIKNSPEDQRLLFTMELPVEFDGTVPMRITVTNSNVVFAHVLSNYNFHGSGPENFFPVINGKDARSEVEIDEVPQTTLWETTGTWSWQVNSGSTISYNLNVAGGTAP